MIIGCPAGARFRAGQRPDPLAGMTRLVADSNSSKHAPAANTVTKSIRLLYARACRWNPDWANRYVATNASLIGSLVGRKYTWRRAPMISGACSIESIVAMKCLLVDD